MTPQRLLVFQTAFLGDAILSIPLLKTLKVLFPHAQLGLVCRRGVGTLFVESGLVHQVVEVDKKDSKSIGEGFLKTKEFAPDLVISPHRSFRTALWVWRLHARETVGFRDLWTLFAYKKNVFRDVKEHDVRRQLSLLYVLPAYKEAFLSGKKSFPKDLSNLEINLPPGEKFSSLQNFVALSPGSQWRTKRWTQEGFIDVGKKLRETGYGIAVLGVPDEMDLCRSVTQKIPGAVNLCGQTTVLELAQVLKRAKLLVCNDSGTMHVATAVGTPVVSIFGATVPSQGFAPWSDKAHIVEIKLACRPCGAHGHNDCPLKHHNCMNFVTPEMVHQYIQTALSGSSFNSSGNSSGESSGSVPSSAPGSVR